MYFLRSKISTKEFLNTEPNYFTCQSTFLRSHDQFNRLYALMKLHKKLFHLITDHPSLSLNFQF